MKKKSIDTIRPPLTGVPRFAVISLILMFTGCASGQITLIKQKEARLDSFSDFHH